MNFDSDEVIDAANFRAFSLIAGDHNGEVELPPSIFRASVQSQRCFFLSVFGL